MSASEPSQRSVPSVANVPASEPDYLFPPPLRPFATALGCIFAGLGILGSALPLMPGTVFLITAAWLFARSSPRFEAWLLGLPVVGQMVTDYRSGAGMPLRAKWFACASIVLAVSLSLGRIPVLVGQVAWVLVGLVGVWFIAVRVPTKR